MGYVDESLAENETVLHRAAFHWFYTATAVFWLIVLGWAVVGIVIFLVMMIRKWTTEIAVTNHRLIYKRGWIARTTDEINLNRLEEMNLEQSVLGRLFGYGQLRVRGVGSGEILFPNIDQPMALRAAINKAKGD